MTSFAQLAARVATCRIFPARRDVPLALRQLVDYISSDQPINRADRLALAALLVGALNRTSGRPALSEEDHKRRDSLVTDARAMRDNLRTEGIPYHDALSAAANWAKDQPRNTEGRKAASLRKDIQRLR